MGDCALINNPTNFLVLRSHIQNFCILAPKNCNLVERCKLCEWFKYIIEIRAKIINLQGHYLPILFLRTSAEEGDEGKGDEDREG